jgi:hypothetical protein
VGAGETERRRKHAVHSATATVYLLRVPNDSATIEVTFGARTMAVLPPSTYTVVNVPPGTTNCVER